MNNLWEVVTVTDLIKLIKENPQKFVIVSLVLDSTPKQLQSFIKKFIKDKAIIIDNIEEMKDYLKSNNGYHFRIHEKEQYIFFGDLDNYKNSIDDLTLAYFLKIPLFDEISEKFNSDLPVNAIFKVIKKYENQIKELLNDSNNIIKGCDNCNQNCELNF